MKKYLIMFFLTLPYGIFAINLADLEVDPRTKQQIADGFALKQSINQYIEQNQSSTPVVTVGGDNACDYRIGTTKIQDAINAHTSVEIRIAQNDVYNENLVINDNNVSLRGGYENCTDAANDIHAPFYAPWTAIRGITGTENPVIKIVGNTQRNTIVLERLFLSNGEGETINFPGGGISIYQVDAQISLINTHITNNNSLRGGGIAVIEGDTDIIAKDLVLTDNTAKAGGGFYCDGSNASLTMYGASGLYENIANGVALNAIKGGGGVYSTNGCSFVLYSGYGARGIDNNVSSARGGGGGIKARAESIVTLVGHEVCSLSSICFGTNSKPVNLTSNHTALGNQGSGGGGAHISNVDTMLNIYAGNVTNNKVLFGIGGAVYLVDKATFTTKRLSKACWSQENCNYYAKNTAKAGMLFGRGGAIVCQTATLSVANTVFAYNRSAQGTVMSLNTCTSSIRGGLMYQNGNFDGDGTWGDKYIISSVGGVLEVHHSTIADNNATEAVIRIWNVDVNIKASIIHDESTGPVLSGNSAATANIECSMLHENTSVTSQAFTVVDDPKFRDRTNQNYRLDSKTSPAVDYCYANTGNYRDIDFQERGWDNPAVINLHGPYDIGADETYVAIAIFANGFE